MTSDLKTPHKLCQFLFFASALQNCFFLLDRIWVICCKPHYSLHVDQHWYTLLDSHNGMFPFSSFKMAILNFFLDYLITHKSFIYLQRLVYLMRKKKILAAILSIVVEEFAVKEDVFYFAQRFCLITSCVVLVWSWGEPPPPELPEDSLTSESHPALSVPLWATTGVTARVSHQALSSLRSLEWGLCATFLI